MRTINRNAKREFNLPHRSKSGTSKYSKIFIMATINIWTMAFSLEWIRLKTHIAMSISLMPMKIVIILDSDLSRSKMRLTISSCLGTR